MIQNYKCSKIKTKCSESFHTIDATFLKIHSDLSHVFVAKCFRSEISLDQGNYGMGEFANSPWSVPNHLN